jgi:hypothetical protein
MALMGYAKGDGLASCRSILIAHCEAIPPLVFFVLFNSILFIYYLNPADSNHDSCSYSIACRKTIDSFTRQTNPIRWGPNKRVTAGRALLWHPLSYADSHSTLPLIVNYYVDI